MDDEATPSSFAHKRQREIFTDGFRGSQPSIPVNYNKLERAARQVMSAEAFSYVVGGAGAESTIRANRRSFDRWQIQPRMLTGTSDVDMRVDILGTSSPAPFMLAPTGVLEMAHSQADAAVAKAAKAARIPFIFSSQASVDMEKCAQVMKNSPRWFQLYWSTNDALIRSFVQRAEQCGCEAIVLTLDTTNLGWRPRDLDVAYLPFLEAKGIAQYISDPVFNQMVAEAKLSDDEVKITFTAVRKLLQMSRRFPGSTWQNFKSKKPLKVAKTFIETYSRPSLNWNDLQFLRSLTSLPILLKGILHPDDARKAAEHGMDGIIVSNHGGRQVDGAVSALQMLPKIAQSVGKELTVLFDSGIRSGADIFKALSLGADSVLLGRPYVYRLAIAGQEGVKSVIKNFRAELELTMALSGCSNIEAVKSTPLLETQHG